MDQSQLNWIANFIWGIADDVLRDLYVRGKYIGAPRLAVVHGPRPLRAR